MTPPILAVIDRGSQGTAEQYADLLYFCVGLRTSFGRMDLMLRGSAVVCALEAPDAGALVDDDATAGKLADAQRYLRTLVRTGVEVWADHPDLVVLGHPAPTLLDGVATADTDALAVRWPEYEKVWFL